MKEKPPTTGKEIGEKYCCPECGTNIREKELKTNGGGDKICPGCECTIEWNSLCCLDGNKENPMAIAIPTHPLTFA